MQTPMQQQTQPQTGLLRGAGPAQAQPTQAHDGSAALSDDALQAQYIDAYEYVEKLSVHPQAVEQLANMMAEKETPSAGIAEAAAFIMVRVEAHKTLDDEVKLELIGDVLEVAFEIAGEMALIDEQEVTEGLIQQVMRLATERYAQMKEQAGMPSDLEHARQGLQELEQSGAMADTLAYFGDDGEALGQMLQLAHQGGQ